MDFRWAKAPEIVMVNTKEKKKSLNNTEFYDEWSYFYYKNGMTGFIIMYLQIFHF